MSTLGVRTLGKRCMRRTIHPHCVVSLLEEALEVQGRGSMLEWGQAGEGETSCAPQANYKRDTSNETHQRNPVTGYLICGVLIFSKC